MFRSSIQEAKSTRSRTLRFILRLEKSWRWWAKTGLGRPHWIKLLTRLYSPTQGRILFDGLDLQAWDQRALHDKLGVIFQDLRSLSAQRG